MIRQEVNSRNPEQPEIWYYDSIGEILDEIKEQLLDDDEDEHLLSLSQEDYFDRISEKDIRFFIYKNGESQPFSSLEEDTDFQEWLSEMVDIKESKIMNFYKFNLK